MARSTAINIPLPSEVKPAKRNAIATAIMDYIVERSKQDNDMSGRSFPDYTKDYAKAKGQSKVDLTLSDTMLKAIEKIRDTKGQIRVGYKSGSEQREKAEGNHYGTYGKSSPISGKARPFIGFVGKEREQLVSIIATYGEVSKAKTRQALKGTKVTP